MRGGHGGRAWGRSTGPPNGPTARHDATTEGGGAREWTTLLVYEP